MAKKLNTTVHLVVDNETGETRVLGPGSKLSSEDHEALKKNWGKRYDEFFDDDDEDGDDYEMPSQQEALEDGKPLADSQPADSSPAIEEAMEIREQARTDANPAGVADAEEGGPQGSVKGRRSGR